jgi:hypothetical protein
VWFVTRAGRWFHAKEFVQFAASIVLAKMSNVGNACASAGLAVLFLTIDNNRCQ